MAYNPFNIFRRNQKALFAVLTVFIMVMFTISSGVAGVDFFDTVARWMGTKPGEVVCKIDGRKITSYDLEGGQRGLQFKRLMANRFMYYAAIETVGQLRQSATQQSEKLSPAGRAMSDDVQRGFQALDSALDPQTQLLARFNPNFERQRQATIARAYQSTEFIIEDPRAKEEDKNVARAYRTALVLRRMLQEAPRDHYFVNAPNKTRRDMIEFELWEKKADQLGIRFGRDDVKRLIQREFSDYFRSDVNVRKRLTELQPGFTIEACLDALASEFRVRAAQVAVLGSSARYHGAPVFSTPYEAFEFYRDQCSPTTYEVIAVPDAAWLDKVSGEPSESELNELYAKYANDEPNPKNETPGFKTPRKIEVGFLGITGEEPYYKKLAEEQIRLGEVMAKASGALTVPVPGVGGAWAAGVLAPLSLKEPAVDAAYNAKVEEFNRQKQQNYEKSTLTPRRWPSTLEGDDPILPTNAVRPGVVAATLGGMIGESAGFGAPGAAAALAMTAPLAYEIRERVALGVPYVLGAIPGPALFQTMIGGAVAFRAQEPKPLPIQALRPDLLKETIDKRAKALAFGDRRNPTDPRPAANAEKGDVARFTEELKKLSDGGKSKDRAAVDKYIQEFIAARGLTHVGKSTAPHDEWTLADDPGLAPLVEAQKMSLLLASRSHGGEYMPFGRSFFWKDDFDFATMSQRRTPTSGLYLADTYPPQEPEARPGQPRYVVWRTEDVAPKKVDRSAAREATRAAWKRIKARELARQYADAMAQKIRTSTATSDVSLEPLLNQLYFDLQLSIKDPKASLLARKFKIDNVAPLVVSFSSMRPFSLTESNDIPYPTPQMTTELLENRDKGFKTVLVLPDAPKDTFYVAVLTKRELKQPSDFMTEVASSIGPAREILDRSRGETIRKARDSVVELLKKEFRYEETDDQKKKLDENTKSGGRSDD